jgi:hypothetical protein
MLGIGARRLLALTQAGDLSLGADSLCLGRALRGEAVGQ